MKQFAVIGDPVAHSLSPVLHREIYHQLGMEAAYEKVHVTPDQLSDFMIQNEFDGLNVTIPHKTAVIPFLNELDESAEIIGAVNCISGGKGYNTDWIGFLKAMELNDVELSSKDCLILGAGGAAQAAAYALIKAKIKSIAIQNRSKDKADQLADWIKNLYRENEPNNNPDIIINCTPVGMWPDTESVPMNVNDINENQIMADTIYNPLEIEWLKQGKEKGAKIVGGFDMFITQGLASADIWFGESISEKVDLNRLKQTLIAAI